MNIQDLKKEISQMSDEELHEYILDARKRRTTEKSTKRAVKEKKQTKKVEEKISLDISKMTPQQQLELFNILNGNVKK